MSCTRTGAYTTSAQSRNSRRSSRPRRYADAPAGNVSTSTESPRSTSPRYFTGAVQGKSRPTPRRRASSNIASSPQPHVSVAFPLSRKRAASDSETTDSKDKETERVHRENDMPGRFSFIVRIRRHPTHAVENRMKTYFTARFDLKFVTLYSDEAFPAETHSEIPEAAHGLTSQARRQFSTA